MAALRQGSEEPDTASAPLTQAPNSFRQARTKASRPFGTRLTSGDFEPAQVRERVLGRDSHEGILSRQARRLRRRSWPVVAARSTR